MRGAHELSVKLSTVLHYQRNQLKAKNCECLASSRIEDLDIGLYKGFGNTWYWVPQCTNGSCAWVRNPNPCVGGKPSCTDPDNVLVQVDKATGTAAPCE